MQKQPHREIEKTADNRYWQNQFHNDDAELGTRRPNSRSTSRRN